MQSRTEEEAAGMRSEVEIATAEMERAQQRLVALERERESLLAQVSTAPLVPASVLMQVFGFGFRWVS